MKTDNRTTTATDLTQLIAKLKKKDRQAARVYNIMLFIYIIIIVIPHVAVISKSIYNNNPYTDWIGYLGVLSLFSILAFFMIKRRKEHKKADYSQPTYLVLKNIERRYKYFRLSDLWVFVVSFFLGLSMGHDFRYGFLAFELAFWIAMMIGILVGYVYWYVKIKPLKDRSSHLLKEL